MPWRLPAQCRRRCGWIASLNGPGTATVAVIAAEVDRSDTVRVLAEQHFFSGQ
ncbi:MAG: hypothetical protein ABJA34_10800 [Pseudonocardiales bacterium]